MGRHPKDGRVVSFSFPRNATHPPPKSPTFPRFGSSPGYKRTPSTGFPPQRQKSWLDHVIQESYERDKGTGKIKSAPAVQIMAERLKTLEKKSADRRKGLDRRSAEKKSTTGTNSSQGDKSSIVHKKSGVITILQRPRTMEAAAENIALFMGRPINGVPEKVVAQHLEKRTAVQAGLFKDVEVSGNDGETDNGQLRSSRNTSPKKGMKKKPSRDFSSKAASWAAAGEVTLLESRGPHGFGVRGESRRLKTVPRAAESAQAEGRETGNTEPNDDEGRLHMELDVVTEAAVDEILKNIDKELNQGHVPAVRLDQLVSGWSNDGVTIIPGGLRRGSSDSFAGEIRQAAATQNMISRCGSLRDVSRGDDNAVELFFFPSSPRKSSERWAGPAYTNSPPPCTLPFPTFPLQRLKASTTEITLADVALRGPEDRNLETVSVSAPPSPARVASLLFSATALRFPFVDPSSATKDLRRMLNLDVEDGFDVTSKWSKGGVESATQSLKRILQLG